MQSLTLQLALLLLVLLFSCSLFVADARAAEEQVVNKAEKKFPSYQSDTVDVIRGIEGGEYDQIYIQYHRCVWSEFADADAGDDNGDDSRCNGGGNDNDGGGNAPWYMGNTQCYRANVAYSLYGVRSGDKTPDDACRKKYYINSFFTNNGVQDFGNLLGLQNHGDAKSQCTLADDEENGDENAQNENDGASQQNNAQQLYPNARSYTTYCASGAFVTAMFSGAYCTGKGSLEMIDTLTDLNKELQSVDCVLAYSSDYDYDRGNNNNNNDNDNDNNNDNDNDNDNNKGGNDENENGRRHAEEEDGGAENDYADVWDLLSYSSSCSILEYPKGCPDPYDVKRRFDLNPRSSNGILRYMHGIDWLTLILFVLGTFMMFLACAIKDRDDNENKKSKRRFFGFRRNRSRSPSSKSRERSSSRDNKNRNSSSNNNNKDSDSIKTDGSRRSFGFRRNRSKSPAKARERSRSRNRKKDSDTVNSNGEPVKKKGVFGGFLSRNK